MGFASVTPSPSQVGATSVAQAVWSYSPRSLTDIQSLTAAIQNNNPSLLSTLSDILYVPAPYYAGQVSATQVAAFLDNLVLNYGLAGPVAAAISASPYGLWSTNFITQVIPYLSATSIAQVLYSNQMDANHAQLILYWLAQNYYYNEWINIVTANAGSTTISTNVTVVNPMFAQNLTIASGVTVTCGTHTCFFVAQSFNNYGTVVSQNGAAGGTGGGIGNSGGTGGGGIVILAVTSTLGTIDVTGGLGGTGYTGPGTPSRGGNGGTGSYIIIAGVTVPAGGAGGTGSYSQGAGNPSGGGGGGGHDAAGGNGGVSVVIVFPNANSMLTYVVQGLSDWWLVNVAVKTPSSITPLTFIYGSGGGGGGGATNNYYVGGGGGGGAGEVITYGYVINGGTINAVGGTGGYEAGGAGVGAGAGGGGGGGLVFVFYGSTASSLTVNVAGGLPGTGATLGATGQPGTAYIAAVTVNG